MYKQQHTRPEVHRQQDDWNDVHDQMLEVQAQQKIQKKSLSVSDPDDADEKEADRIAKKTVSGSEISRSAIQQGRKDTLQLQNDPDKVTDYTILLTEPMPKLLPSILEPGKTIEVEDPFAYPSASVASYAGEDKIMDVRIERSAYQNGKYASNTVGTIHVKKSNDAVTAEYPDPIKQLAQFEFSEKDLYKLHEVFWKIPGLESCASLPFLDFKNQVGVARKVFLREQKRKANNSMPGSIGKHIDEAHPEEASDINKIRYVVYENEVRWKGSNAWRNNNPGNVTKTTKPFKYGEIGYDEHKPILAIYPDYATGRAAMRSVLLNVYSRSTILRTMTGWDPSSGDFYAKFVSKQTGLPTSTLIGDLNETQLTSVMDAIETMEHTEAGVTFKCGAPGNPQWVQDLLQCD